jgi:hypothetical protein
MSAPAEIPELSMSDLFNMIEIPYVNSDAEDERVDPETCIDIEVSRVMYAHARDIAEMLFGLGDVSPTTESCFARSMVEVHNTDSTSTHGFSMPIRSVIEYDRSPSTVALVMAVTILHAVIWPEEAEWAELLRKFAAGRRFAFVAASRRLGESAPRTTSLEDMFNIILDARLAKLKHVVVADPQYPDVRSAPILQDRALEVDDALTVYAAAAQSFTVPARSLPRRASRPSHGTRRVSFAEDAVYVPYLNRAFAQNRVHQSHHAASHYRAITRFYGRASVPHPMACMDVFRDMFGSVRSWIDYA